MKLGAATALGLDTDPIAIEATVANARRNGVGPAGPRARGQPAERRAGRSTSCWRTSSPGCSSRWPRGAARRAPARRPPARVGHLHRPRAGGPRGLRGGRLDVTGRTAEGRLGRARGRPTGPDAGPRPPTIAAMPPFFPVLLGAHIVLAIEPVPAVDPAAVRAPTPARDGRVGRVGVVRSCCGLQSHGTVVIGVGLALTGLGLVADARLGRSSAAVAARRPGDLLLNLGSRSSSSARTCAASSGSGPPPTTALAGAGPAPALHLVCDGRAGRYHRLPDEHEAGALVTERDDEPSRPPTASSAGSSPARSRRRASTRTTRRRVPGHRPAGADPHPAHPAPPHRVGRRPDRGRRPAARPAVRRGRRHRPRPRASPRAATGSSRTSDVGRPDGRPPPLPPHGRPPIRLAARMTVRGRRTADRALALARRAACSSAACGTTRGPTAACRSSGGAAAGPSRRRSTRPGELVRALGEHDSCWPTAGPRPTGRGAAPRGGAAGRLPGHPARGPERRLHRRLRVPDPARAAAAAAEQPAYLATGPAGSRHRTGRVSILRQVGSTVVFYSWLPQGRPTRDPGDRGALETLGVGFPVPS